MNPNLPLNWQPLFDWINEKLTIDVKFHIDLSGKRPRIVSPNLVNESGIFRAVCKEVEVGIFSFGYTENIGDNKRGFWASVYLFYESNSGGSNGMEIGHVWYDADLDKWRFTA